MGILSLQIWRFENYFCNNFKLRDRPVPNLEKICGPIQQLVQSEPVVSASVYESVEGARDQHDKQLTFVYNVAEMVLETARNPDNFQQGLDYVITVNNVAWPVCAR